MPALSSRHGTAFRLLRIGALLVACLVFLWGCEVSRSSTLHDVPEHLVLAALAAAGALVAGWFEIRAVRAARRTVTMDDGRWRVVARVGGAGELVFVGHDEEPVDSDDPEDAPSGWIWTFPAESLDAVRAVLALCFPDDDPEELAELELLDLLGEVAGVLDPVARADPGAWLHGHGVPGERHEWGVDPTQTTRTLPIVGTPLGAAPGRRGGVSPATRERKRGGSSARERERGQPSARERERDEPSARERERDEPSARERGLGESPAPAKRDRGAPGPGTESSPRNGGSPPGATPTRNRGGGAPAPDRAPGRSGAWPGRGARSAANREDTPDQRTRRGTERADAGRAARSPADRSGEKRPADPAMRAGDAATKRGSGQRPDESAGRAQRDGPGARAGTERTGVRRGGEAAAERGRRRTEAPGERGRNAPDPARDQQYSGPIRRRGVGRQEHRADPDHWWETADGPTDRTYREPPPPRLSNPRRRREE